MLRGWFVDETYVKVAGRWRYVYRAVDNNRLECDHGRLKARLRPMRGLKTDLTASVVIRGHAFIQNLRHGHYELGSETHQRLLRIGSAFEELTETIWPTRRLLPTANAPDDRTTQHCRRDDPLDSRSGRRCDDKLASVAPTGHGVNCLIGDRTSH